jgi:hypothetical protein
LADSLVLANIIELLGQDAGVPSAIPSCAGAIFRLGDDYDLGAPVPVVDILGELAVDGERPFGQRASNRTIKLPVVIEVPFSAGSDDPRKTLAAAREVLLSAVNQQVWTLTQTRDGGSPLIFDCFRASAYDITYDHASDISLACQLEITFQALPYGRADQQDQIPFPVPVPGTPAPPPAPLVLDSFASITGAQWSQSSQCIVGPRTAYWDPGAFPARRPDGAGTPLAYTATLPAPVNVTGLTALSLYAGLGAAQSYYVNLEWRGRTRCYVAFTLTDVNGSVLQFQSSRRVPVSPNVFGPAWTYVTAAIPQGVAGFDYTQVAAYSVTITNRAGELRWVHAYLDALTAQPPSQAVGPASVRGQVYRLAGIKGTSRAPVSLTFQQVPTAGTPSVLTGTGGYTVPPGTVTLKAEGLGGGGAGASLTVGGVGGGGGGAEYAREDTLPVTPGQVIPYQCGVAGTAGATPADGGDTTFGGGPGQTAVTAHGGKSVAQDSSTGALGGSGSTNSVAYPGGTGRTASGSVGGGGGSSGGTSGPGLTPTGTTATVFNTPGPFSWTCPPGVTSILVEPTGAGGGSASAANSYYGPGAGAGGEYAGQTIAVTPGHVYGGNVGSPGAGGPAGGNAGSPGSNSSFTGDAATVTAHGGQGGTVNTFRNAGQGGQPGTGSTAAAHFDGGQGGPGYPYSGGGGSSAGPGSAGNAGDGYGDPGPAPSGGGSGGAGRTGNGAGFAGAAPGGGGGASYVYGYAGGAGAAGQVKISYPGGGAPTNNGAAAVAGGGAGGAGGPSANTPGSAGAAPGGGGGGADSSGSAEAGGPGGAGKITVTPFSSQPFKTLLAHRPGPDAPPSLNPLVPVGNGADVPNGATQYPVPSLVAGVNARFGGTYTVLLANFTWNNPTAARTITVTVTQAEYASGPSYATSASVTVTPTGGVTNGFVTVGELTLPYKDIAADNQSAVFTVSVTDTNTADRHLDVLFLDTTGETLVVNEPTTGYVTYFADEPDPDRDLGRLLGSQFGRPDAISVLDAAIISGGPLTVDPAAAAAILLVYALEGSPAVAMSYFPRYWIDRV